eukprot:GHVU01002227.1.p1 GENE.GHVU01002227.1~~GHVU01002227.1.p1  ORF type:complete len:136 (-),score=14.75 GHVU01002227.1:325-732(-)
MAQIRIPGEYFERTILSAMEKGRKELQQRPDSRWRLEKLLNFYELADGSSPRDYTQPECGDGGETPNIHALMPLFRPACMGDGKVDFSKFADNMSGNYSMLEKRFFEYLFSGFCERCQVAHFEVGYEVPHTHSSF